MRSKGGVPNSRSICLSERERLARADGVIGNTHCVEIENEKTEKGEER